MRGNTKEYNDCDKWIIDHKVRVLLFGESELRGRNLIFDSFHYQSAFYGKNPTHDTDTYKITEMVFGSLVSRCYDTCFKIHNLSSPHRVIFTQIFPIHPSRKMILRGSSLKNTSNILSTNNFLSAISLSGPIMTDESDKCHTSSTICTSDSGFTEDSYHTETTSSLSSLSNIEDLSFSTSELFMDETEQCLNYCNGSASEFIEGLVPQSSCKMGLVFIVVINTDKEKFHGFCMKHISFIESIIFRVRKTIEFACNKPTRLLSTMIEVSNESIDWLMDLFSKAHFFKNSEVEELKSLTPWKEDKSKVFSLHKLLYAKINRRIHYNVTIPINKKTETCFKEFCGLLMKLEIKERNLFMSTLVTATLTYHLGWVATCFSLNKNCMPYIRNSYNSLWVQMSELCGALGHPLKSCRTILNASNVNLIISEILHSLNYFVRYSTVEYKRIGRNNITNENGIANAVCEKQVNSIGRNTNSQLCKSLSKCHLNISNRNETKSIKKNTAKQEKLHFILGDDEYNEEEGNTNESEYRENCFIANSEEIPVAISTNKATLTRNCRTLEDIVTNKINCNSVTYIQDTNNEFIDDIEISTKQTKTLDSLEKSSRELLDQGITYNIIDSEKHEDEEKYFYNQNITVFGSNGDIFHTLRLLVFPLPRSKSSGQFEIVSCASILRSNNIGKYIPDMVIQGTSLSDKECVLRVKKDLSLRGNNYSCNEYMEESITIVGNIDNWNVNIFSSYISALNHNDSEVRVEISLLVENMLEITLQIWNQYLCREYCITHMEQRLLEICIYSMAVAHFLLDTDFCVMDLLISSLHLQVNDIPLLMAVASTVTPQVTKKYGISFQ